MSFVDTMQTTILRANRRQIFIVIDAAVVADELVLGHLLFDLLRVDENARNLKRKRKENKEIKRKKSKP